MTKRITALLIAVLLPITFIFTGCGSKELTLQEYKDQLYDDFTQYLSSLEEINDVKTDVSTLAELQEQKSKAVSLCRKAKTILSLYTAMTPPAQFADKHKKLNAAVELEKGFVQSVEDIFNSTSADELSKNTKKSEAYFDGTPEEQQFGAVFMELFLDVNSALGSGQ